MRPRKIVLTLIIYLLSLVHYSFALKKITKLQRHIDGLLIVLNWRTMYNSFLKYGQKT